MSDQPKAGVSRRNFAKASAAAASFAILTAKSGVAETNSGTLRAGLLGCGGRGTGAAVNFLEGNSNVKIVAMADILDYQLKGSLDRLKSGKPEIAAKVDVSPEMQFVGVDSYKEILKTDIDILIHGTTPYCRPQHIEAAVEAGKHIFTEKPVAVDPNGIRQFIAAAKKAAEKKLCIVTGTQRRHQKPYVETIKKIHEGAIGDILACRAYWNGSLPFTRPRQPEWSDLEDRLRNWYAHCWVCGDNIVEQHVHNLDVINWVMGGPPAKVVASGGRAWKHLEKNPETYGDLWDNFSCDYEYPNGVHMLSMSRHWPSGSASNVSEYIVGAKGGSNCRDMGQDGIDPYVQEHIDLVAAVRGEAPYINEGVQCAESTMTAIMGRMAAYTGKEYTWEQALNEDLNLVPPVLDFSLPYPVGEVPVPKG
jgi:predicted dehydrogenase